MDGSWRSKNDGYRPQKLRDATLDVRNSEGTAPARGVEAALVDKSKLTSIRDPKILGRMGMEINKDGKLVTKVDTLTYGTCRRARLMPYPSHWASVGMGAFEFLMVLLFIGGLATAYYQIDSADILNVGVVNMRTLLATIASVSTVWVCVLAAGAFTNGKNEKMAFEAIQADRDLGSLYNQVQCNCPQIRWGFLHQLLFCVGHWVNFAYLHAEINDSNLGGSTFPTFSEGLARLYRVRVWITAIMCTMQLSIFLLDYFDLSHLMMYSGPATEISSDGSNALQLCEPLDGGNKYNYEGNLKLVVDFYGLARIGFIVFNMYVVYELIKQLTYYRFLPIQWSPETWRTVVLAEWCIHLIIFGLAAGAAIAMNGVKCARAQAVKVAALHSAFFVAWIVLHYVGFSDFITVTGRTHLATQADRERFENMLWFSLLISSEAIYLTAVPWLRCQLNNGAFETFLEYMPDFL